MREALLCTFSILWMSLARCGDHTGLAYSKIGRTRVLYKIEKCPYFHYLSQVPQLFALPEQFLQHVLSTSGPLAMITPRSLYLDTFLNSVPERWYRVVLLFLVWVILMTLHLLGLNFTYQRSANRSRVVRSDCKAIESSTFINSR